MDKKWKKVGAFIGNLDIYLTCVLLVFLVGLTFVGVFTRYIFSEPIVWQEEVQLAVFSEFLVHDFMLFLYILYF